MDLANLKAEIEKSYTSFQSYEDSGSFESDQSYHTGGWFRTFFLRKPRMLLFEWSPKTGDHNKTVFMVKGNQAQLLQSQASKELFEQNKLIFVPKKQYRKIQAVGRYSDISPGLRGITNSASELIVETLVTEKCTWTSEKYAFMQDAVLNGVSCYRLRKIYAPQVVWISKDDFTVRRSELDGIPIINEFVRSTIRESAKLINIFSNRDISEEARQLVESNMKTEVWTFKNVRYNHLSENTFPFFEFKEI